MRSAAIFASMARSRSALSRANSRVVTLKVNNGRWRVRAGVVGGGVLRVRREEGHGERSAAAERVVVRGRVESCRFG